MYHLQKCLKNEIYSYKKSLIFNDSSGDYFILNMESSMIRYRLVSLCLNRYIFEKSIKYKIIKYLSDMESYDYYIERYKTISYLYNKSFIKDYWRERKFISYVLNSEIYISKPDDNMDFYNETGQSYQVRNLVLSLLSIPNDNSDILHNDSLLSNDIKEWREIDDSMYGILAKNIMDKIVLK